MINEKLMKGRAVNLGGIELSRVASMSLFTLRKFYYWG